MKETICIKVNNIMIYPMKLTLRCPGRGGSIRHRHIGKCHEIFKSFHFLGEKGHQIRANWTKLICIFPFRL